MRGMPDDASRPLAVRGAATHGRRVAHALACSPSCSHCPGAFGQSTWISAAASSRPAARNSFPRLIASVSTRWAISSTWIEPESTVRSHRADGQYRASKEDLTQPEIETRSNHVGTTPQVRRSVSDDDFPWLPIS